MVEFALVLPIFLISIIAIIEFAFAFSTLNSLNFAARDLALVVAEGGNQAGSDCSALTLLEREFGASSNPSGITSVRIYWSDGNGNVVNNATNLYNRSGSMVCTDLSGASQTLPYTPASITYLETERCSVLNGCPSPPAAIDHPTLDTIGVQITYAYSWRTPMGSLIGPIVSPTFTATQQMRMEPIL